MGTEKPTFHLLVVDDNPTNLELMARIVESHLPEVRCLTALSAADGFRLLEEERIDGAFVDVQMPAVNGFDMCRQLKGDPKTAHIPVVLLTAHIATPQSRAEGLDAGAQDFISQPVSNIEMLARIRVMLRLQRERESLSTQNQQLHQQLENNVGALRWLTGLLDAGNNTTVDSRLLEKLAAGLDGAQEPTPDQFANWLLPELPKGWQNALLKLALLETIPLELARRLTPIEDVEAILDYLWRHNFHVEAFEGGYRFDNPLQGYLNAQAKTQLSSEEQLMVHRQAADWNQEKRDYWAALRHLLEGQLFEEVEFLLSQTGLLLPVTATLEIRTLLDLLPENLAAKKGWLSLFVGSCKLLFTPDEVDNWFELAQARFVATGDHRGELLTLAQKIQFHMIVDGRFSLGRQMLPRIIELLDLYREDLDSVNLSRVFCAISIATGFFVGDTVVAEKHARSCLLQAQKSGIAVLELEGRILCGYMAMLQGGSVVACSEVENAWQVTARISPESLPLYVLPLYVLSASLLLHIGDVGGYREQRRQLSERFGRHRVRQGTIGIALYLFDVEACLLEGDWDTAAEMVRIGSAEGAAADNPHLRSWILQYRALLHAHSGRVEEAKQDVQESLSLREQAGGGVHSLENMVVCAEVFLQLDDLNAAQDLLHRALDLSQASSELFVQPAIHAAFTRLFQRQGLTVLALSSLQKFLSIFQTRQHKCCFFLTPEHLAILPLAQENGVLPEVASRLASNVLHCDLRNDGWLVPHLKISLLGPFRLQIGTDSVIEASSLGAPGRHLLGLLIFAPGQQHAVDTLYGKIWPESSPDKARQNFDSTLMRVRKALDEAGGNSIGRSYLAVERGILFLLHTRVDAIAFKNHVIQARTLQRRGDSWQACHQLLAADRLWHGKLMEGFDLPGDFFELQGLYDELRFEQIELLTGLGGSFCNVFDLETLLLQGLQADPIRESFIKSLLVLYRKQHDQIKQKRLLSQYQKSLQAEDFTTKEIAEIMRAL